LSRTSWRGIRGGMTGGGWAYGWLFFRLQLLRVTGPRAEKKRRNGPSSATGGSAMGVGIED
jgi:hypothetical protein